MNQKEIAELRRRFRPEKSDLVRIRGCYVNERREVVSEFYQNIGTLTLMESDGVLGILRKTLSGTLGKNLIDVEFANQQVMGSEEHDLLMALRKSALDDAGVAAAFYQRIIPGVDVEGSFMILLAYDNYAVPSYHQDGQKAEESSEEFPFVLCCICPVKTTKPALSFYANESRFRNLPSDNIVSAPEIGFLFPAFDERCANIYNALLYSRSAEKSHAEFVKAAFNRDAPMPAAAQKETFDAILSETVSEDCGYEVVQAVQEQLSEMLEAHKANKEPVPLQMTREAVAEVLDACGVPAERLTAFSERFDAAFGQDALLTAGNLVNAKQLEIKTPDVCVKVNPERGDLIETRVIGAHHYILIRADEGMEVNGVSVQIR